MLRKNQIGATFQTLEAREVPAVITTFRSGNLRIAFNNDGATAQSVVISSVQGKVTLNERPTAIRAAAVKSITVVGSALNNFIDLRFVSTGTGFRGLNGKVSLLGNGGDDVLIGSQFGDKLSGGEGFDQLMGGNGNDTLNGGNGHDWIYPGEGNDVIVRSPGNDWIDLGPDDRLI